jgi:hypothetical protein
LHPHKKKVKIFPASQQISKFFLQLFSFFSGPYQAHAHSFRTLPHALYLFALLGMNEPSPALTFPRFIIKERKRIFDLSQSDPQQNKIKLI